MRRGGGQGDEMGDDGPELQEIVHKKHSGKSTSYKQYTHSHVGVPTNLQVNLAPCYLPKATITSSLLQLSKRCWGKDG